MSLIPKPPLNEGNRYRFLLAFETMWSNGVFGTYFFVVLRNLAVHLPRAGLTPDWYYTLDLFLKYGYLLWFLGYFFVVTLQLQEQARAFEKAARARKSIE